MYYLRRILGFEINLIYLDSLNMSILLFILFQNDEINVFVFSSICAIKNEPTQLPTRFDLTKRCVSYD